MIPLPGQMRAAWVTAKARVRSLYSAHSLISDGGDKGDSGGHHWQKAGTLAQALPLTAA